MIFGTFRIYTDRLIDEKWIGSMVMNRADDHWIGIDIEGVMKTAENMTGLEEVIVQQDEGMWCILSCSENWKKYIFFYVFNLVIRSRSQRRDDDPDRIDKKRLLEIARKNAITMLANGTLPGTQNLPLADKEKILAKMRFGGKSVDELTEFCKKLSKGESAGYLSNVSDDSDHDHDGAEKAFHHPFVLKDRGPIVMNIKVCTSLNTHIIYKKNQIINLYVPTC